MDVQTDKVPPVPQLVPPLREIRKLDPPIDLSALRFDNSWMQWFTQVKYKIDTINENVVGIGNLSGSGIVSRDISGNWNQLTIQGTSGRVAVANGDGVSGNVVIDIDLSYIGQSSISVLGNVSVGEWRATAVAIAYGGTGATTQAGARSNLDAAKAMSVTSTSATGGTATALPAQPVGYVEIEVGGVVKKIPYYDP